MKTSNNVTIVDLSDGRRVCLSYGVAVAAFIPRGYCPYGCTPLTDSCGPHPYGYLKTARKWPVTSSKHTTAFCGPNATIVPDAVFVQLIAPIEAKGRD